MGRLQEAAVVSRMPSMASDGRWWSWRKISDLAVGFPQLRFSSFVLCFCFLPKGNGHMVNKAKSGVFFSSSCAIVCLDRATLGRRAKWVSGFRQVLKLRGQKLELMLLDVAQQQEAGELIIGLPVSADGRETPQSNKVRSVVGRLAVQAADRGLRVYLQDEHGTSVDALHYMISRGVKRSSRDDKSDAYAAMMILDRYFSSSGQGAQIVLPRQQELQDKLIAKPRQDAEI
ncbi:Putative Holliday junction resolvase [Triticum urartu]|uniref:Putative Holliday junction resolvase n=1 Tax=Triticum urartu TaxID=4572 RepID=M8A6T9_TRIUA|nr:Putative Holliday junction resolvase [Triticum urartu]